jgi:hypothetical protein
MAPVVPGLMPSDARAGASEDFHKPADESDNAQT